MTLALEAEGGVIFFEIWIYFNSQKLSTNWYFSVFHCIREMIRRWCNIPERDQLWLPICGTRPLYGLRGSTSHSSASIWSFLFCLLLTFSFAFIHNIHESLIPSSPAADITKLWSIQPASKIVYRGYTVPASPFATFSSNRVNSFNCNNLGLPA